MTGRQNKIFAHILDYFTRKNKGEYSDLGRYQAILQHAPDAIIEIDRNGNIISSNEKATELSGYPREELCTLNLIDFFTPTSLTEKPVRFDLLDKGQTVKNERELKTKSGKFLFVETNSCALTEGVYISFVRNVTDRITAENEIRVSEARLTRAELTSKTGNWELHLETYRMVGSLGACKIYGIKESELDFEIVRQVPLAEYRPYLDQALKDLINFQKPYDIEFRIKAMDTGEIKNIHSIAIYDAERKVLFGIIWDVTEQKRIEAELRKAKEKAEESDKLKTAFLQNLSHEIRTPMNAIVGFSGLMIEAIDDKDKLNQYSYIINQKCNDLLDIINDILDIARIESNQVTLNISECNLRDLLREITMLGIEYRDRIEKSQINFEVIRYPEPEWETVFTDSGKLKQILMNLITNAFKFTREGSITVSCFQGAKGMLSFSVSDTGIGIPQEQKETIFQRFVQFQNDKSAIYGGTGLGLSIVKGLVQRMDGSIQVESETGKGSTFTFHIPLEISHLVKPASGDSLISKYEKLRNKTILIVEDEKDNAEYLNQLLTGHGIQTLQAFNGKQALDLYYNRPVDLVLMDIQLPDANGYDIARKMREKNANLKIIALTAYTSSDERQKALDAGCNDFLIKPTSKDTLLKVLNDQVD